MMLVNSLFAINIICYFILIIIDNDKIKCNKKSLIKKIIFIVTLVIWIGLILLNHKAN